MGDKIKVLLETDYVKSNYDLSDFSEKKMIELVIFMNKILINTPRRIDTSLLDMKRVLEAGDMVVLKTIERPSFTLDGLSEFFFNGKQIFPNLGDSLNFCKTAGDVKKYLAQTISIPLSSIKLVLRNDSVFGQSMKIDVVIRDSERYAEHIEAVLL